MSLAQQYLDRLTIMAEKQILDQNNAMVEVNINAGLTNDVKTHLMRPHYYNIITINLQKLEAQYQVLEGIKAQLEELKVQFDCDKQVLWRYPTEVYTSSEALRDKLEFVNIQMRGMRYGFRDVLLKKKRYLEAIRAQLRYIL